MKHKKLFISLTAIGTVLLALVIFLMIWFWGDSYKSNSKHDGFENFRREIAIPGLKDGACPQGLASYRTTYTEETGELKDPDNPDGGKVTVEKTQTYFFMSAYFKDEPSRIYVIGEKTGEVGYVTMKVPDKDNPAEYKDYYGHCGGVATNGYTFWMVSDNTVYCAQKDGTSSSSNNITRDIITLAESKGELTFNTSFNANCSASFCYFYDADGSTDNRSTSDKLYVGEFYRPKDYETDELHHVTTNNGYENRAFVYEYNITTTSGNKYGLSLISSDSVAEENRVPKVQNVYSISDEIQGFARTRANGLVLSRSWGLSNSHIYYYDWAKITESSNRKLYRELTYEVKDENGNPKKDDNGNVVTQTYGGFTYEGVMTKGGATYKDRDSVYIYFVDEGSLLNDYSIPSMSEGLCLVNDRVYVLFESGANKYKLFVRQKLTDIYSFIPRAKKN